MRSFTDTRSAESADQIWLVEHDPVYTLGQAADRSHVLAPGDIPLVQTDRGGQVTYHGPGQAVVYPLLNLQRRQIGPRALVFGIEQVLLDYLHQREIPAARKEGAPGIYVYGQKIASIGLRVRKKGCYHGLALNLDMDLRPFLRINPCGYENLAMTQVAEFCPPSTVEQCGRELAESMDHMLQAPIIHPLLESHRQRAESSASPTVRSPTT